MDCNLGSLILILHVLIMVHGAALIGVGGFALVKQAGIRESLKYHTVGSLPMQNNDWAGENATRLTISIIAICVVSGISIIFGSALGAVSVNKKWPKTVAGVVIFYFFISLILAGFGVVCLLEAPKIETELLTELEKLRGKANERPLRAPEISFIAEMQNGFECCIEYGTTFCHNFVRLCPDAIDVKHRLQTVAITCLVAVGLAVSTASLSIIALVRSAFAR